MEHLGKERPSRGGLSEPREDIVFQIRIFDNIIEARTQSKRLILGSVEKVVQLSFKLIGGVAIC